MLQTFLLCKGNYNAVNIQFNQFENYWIGKDGKLHYITWSNTVLVDDSGVVTYVIGTGIEISIKDLALKIKGSLGYKGDIYFNTEKPDGTMRKLTNVDLLNGLGFKHSIELTQGIDLMYNAYLSKQD